MNVRSWTVAALLVVVAIWLGGSLAALVTAMEGMAAIALSTVLALLVLLADGLWGQRTAATPETPYW